MCKWWIHDKWAIKMGIPKQVSEYVNNFIDFPKSLDQNDEYMKFVVVELMKKSVNAIPNIRKLV